MSAQDFDFPTMSRALILGDKDTVAAKTREGLALSMDPKALIFKGLIPGMDVVGEKFRRNEYYVPQVLLSARAMYAGLDLLKPLITAAAKGDDYHGVVVIGTAQGDLHDIGKNLVAMMLEGAGFKVVNLGRDVAPEKFVAAVEEHQANIVGISALMTTTMPAMKRTIDALLKAGLRERVLRDKVRIDGRGLADIRPLSAEVGVIPRVHGSALFERGETQILGVTTLNMLTLEQKLDTLSPETTRRYMHNYNFPPYSTGETGRVGSPKRREIGHGALAGRALMPVLPTREEFPYAIRQVSEALGSNGSTSMGSVCASTLALLQAGVPLRAPVAGIAMGLISGEVEGKTEYVTLTDILGAEDAFGDMDFKVAGTRDFVTALQLDTKLDGIPADVLAGALTQARDARMAILDVMAEAIAEPEEMSLHAPRIITVKVPVDKIGEVIGPKGKVINQIQDDTGAQISIEDDGTIYIGATNGESAEAARSIINGIANPTMPEVGERYLGTVVKTTNFGAFVSLLPGKDGLLHISKLRSLAGGKRVEAVEDVVSVGQKVQVEIAEIDDRGKLSLIPVVEESGEGESSKDAAGSDDGEQ